MAAVAPAAVIGAGTETAAGGGLAAFSQLWEPKPYQLDIIRWLETCEKDARETTGIRNLTV